MGWFISMGLAALICLTAFILGRKFRNDRHEDVRLYAKAASIIAVFVFVIWVGGHTTYNMTYQVPAGNVGVVYEFGAIKGQTGEGLQFVAPWRIVRLANIQVQGHLFERLEAFSQETQDVFVQATLNIRVSPTAIQELYRTVGPNYFDVLVAPRVAQNFKDEIVRYESVNIAPNRETIRQVVRARLERELSSYSIEVVDLLLNNIDFNTEFKDAIEAKQIASQRALEEEQRVLVVRHQAEQAIERARGEGESLLVVARSQAEANHLLSESLTSQLVQYALIQKLGDDIRVIIMPPGQNFILGPDVLNENSDAAPRDNQPNNNQQDNEGN